MFYDDIQHEDFLDLLRALPDPPAVIRAYLVGVFGILVGGDDAEGWWVAMWRDRGEVGAAKVVAQMVISKGGPRVLSMIRAEAADRDVVVRADDPKVARLLFDDSLEDHLSDQWALRSFVCTYYEETQGELEDDDDMIATSRNEEVEDELEREESDSEVEADEPSSGPDLFDLLSGKPRPSAQWGAEWTLERVQNPARGFLTVPSNFKEADLETFLWLHWERIDFGFDYPIQLVGKQVNLNPGNNDRVDLLAKGRAGEHIAVELKIVEARRGDYTQLTSYMGDLEATGVPSNKVRGVLVAPSFSSKVLSSAAIEPRVTLLRFGKGA